MINLDNKNNFKMFKYNKIKRLQEKEKPRFYYACFSWERSKNKIKKE